MQGLGLDALGQSGLKQSILRDNKRQIKTPRIPAEHADVRVAFAKKEYAQARLGTHIAD
jgi:hypothetical protein